MPVRVSALFLLSAAVSVRAAGTVQYNRDVRPVLSDNCFACHGPDANKRKAGLRLDVREEALKPAESGERAIVPGKPEESTLVKRILTADADDLMPPGDSHKQLTDSQKEMLRRWVAEGAEYQAHWAYLPPQKSPVPEGANPVDHLIGLRHAALGLAFSPEADRRTLLRRLHSDLTGLPPTPEETEAFEKDAAPDALERAADRLLASPHYGERMAIGWLDAVRFADTIGYHSDNARNIYPYRDWVIRAFNENKPFDRFTVEQLAGDLLPGSGPAEKTASAFNRLLLTTEEGGAQAMDYEQRYLADRVRAVGTVWLGQTLGCAQCHDHKFDPVTMRDFYRMGAFFADIQEAVIGKREDGMPVPDEAQSAVLTALEAEIARTEKALQEDSPELAAAAKKWAAERGSRLASWQPLIPAGARSEKGAALTIEGDGTVQAGGPAPNNDTYVLRLPGGARTVAALRLDALPHSSLPAGGPGRAGNGNFVLTELKVRVQRGSGPEEEIAFASAVATIEQNDYAEGNPWKAWSAASAIDGDARGARWGWAILPGAGQPQSIVFTLRQPVALAEADVLILELLQNHGDGSHVLGRFRLQSSAAASAAEDIAPLPPEITAVLTKPEEQRSPEDNAKLLAHYRTAAPELQPLRDSLAALRKKQADLLAALPKVLVSVSGPPRTVRVLPRGDWMNETGEIVQPAVPAFLAVLQPAPGARLTRLDLARWIVAPDNPLTARVFVNRLWKQFFGIGLSKVPDDLGLQGEAPPNQELLDTLARGFIDSGWDVKRLVRLMVTSRAWRQSSLCPPDLASRDPANREIARQSRWRMDAELVRDQTLAVAGLISLKVGGPSVRPYQPDGYWENLNFPPRNYTPDQNGDQYRRGLYTWWQRSFTHPAMLAFDAPSREECTAERNRSNIPQQALVLLNDPSWVEAARVFAVRILREGGSDPSSRAAWALRQALQRSPRAGETETLTALAQSHATRFAADEPGTRAFLAVGLTPAPADLPPAELAAWTSVARVIFNLHESIVRE